MNELHIHIDALVLHGFDPHQRHTIADAVQAELQRLFAANPGWTQTVRQEPLRLRRIEAGQVELDHGGPAAVTGGRLAAALHAAIGGALAGTAGRGDG